MPDAPVRTLGTVETVHGQELAVGVDHDAITIDGKQLGPQAAEDFARLYFAADEAAHWWAATQQDDETVSAP